MSRIDDNEQGPRFWRDKVILPLRALFDDPADIFLGVDIYPLGWLHSDTSEHFPCFADLSSLRIRTYDKSAAKKLATFTKRLWELGLTNVHIDTDWTWGEHRLRPNAELVVHMAKPSYVFILQQRKPTAQRKKFPGDMLVSLCMSTDPRAAIPGLDWLKLRSCVIDSVLCEETASGNVFGVHTEGAARQVASAYGAFEGLPACEATIVRHKNRDENFPYQVAIAFRD